MSSTRSLQARSVVRRRGAISHWHLGARCPLPVCPTRHTGRRNKMNELTRWDATSKGLKPAFRDRNVTNGQPDGR